MRPERRHLVLVQPDGDPAPITNASAEADGAALDAELAAAGRQAQRALHGRTQPTRWFAMDLRDRLLAAFPVPAGRD